MPYALVTLGLLLIVTSARNTYSQFGAQVAKDGAAFIPWSLAIFAVGALGYISDFRTFSRYFLALILLAMILSNKGFFQNFTSAIKAGPVAPTATDTTPNPSTSGPNNATTLQQHQSGAFGQAPADSGQAKAFGWFNYLFGN